MSLETAIKKTWIKSNTCSVKRLIEDLSTEDKKAFNDAIQSGIPLATMVRALRTEGYKLSRDTLSAHIKQQCKCAAK